MNLAIIGAGNMGLAIAKSVRSKNLRIIVKPEQLDLKKQTHPDLHFTTNTNIDDTHLIIAIKPQSFDALRTSGEAIGVYSVMAGIGLDLVKKVRAKNHVRVMPNIAAKYNKSASVIVGDNALKSYAMEIFSYIGKTFWLESENQLNIASAIVGSSPAWLAVVAQAMSDGAVQAGLPRDLSLDLIQASFESASSLLAHDHPSLIADKITSPAGTTIQGLRVLENRSVRSAFFEAVIATYEKNKNF